MNKENTLLVLWIIFGFVFVMAVDSLLFVLSHIIYFTEFNFNFSKDLMLYSIPILIFISYLFTTIILVKRIKIKSELSGIFLMDFPIKSFVIYTIIAFFGIPITNWLNGLHSNHVTEIGEISNVFDFFYIQTWLVFGINLSRWAMIIGLALIFITRYKKLKTQ